MDRYIYVDTPKGIMGFLVSQIAVFGPLEYDDGLGCKSFILTPNNHSFHVKATVEELKKALGRLEDEDIFGKPKGPAQDVPVMFQGAEFPTRQSTIKNVNMTDRQLSNFLHGRDPDDNGKFTASSIGEQAYIQQMIGWFENMRKQPNGMSIVLGYEYIDILLGLLRGVDLSEKAMQKFQARVELATVIKSKFIGIRHDEQDVKLEDDDWLMIVEALTS